MDIQYYISQIDKTKNSSAGGSACYDFGSVVLLDYTNDRGRLARKNEEDVFKLVNEKNSLGVNTPKHLAFQRVEKGFKNHCYVLQEKCPGVSFDHYYQYSNYNEKLQCVKRIADFPQEHFNKYASDLIQLVNCGIEIDKPKNLFYDENTANGGFWIIDVLNTGEPLPSNLTGAKNLKKDFLFN